MSARPTARSFTEHLNWSIRLYKAGLRDVHIHVLGSLIESLETTGGLAEGETTVQLSRWELAQRTGLSTQQVQRALAYLVDQGYIVRHQAMKRDGEVARTLLTAKAVAAMGLEGGADLCGNAPPELIALLIGEARSVINAVVSAWNDGTMPAQHVSTEFRGGPRAWTQIEFLLNARMEACLQSLSEAQDAAEASALSEARGEFALAIPSGETITLRSEPFRVLGETPALQCVDMRFVRDTLTCLAIRHPRMVTLEAIPRLVAEIAYSRSAGFVHRHDASAAVKVLASCIARPSWSRPRKIDARWYRLAQASLLPQVDRRRSAN